MKKLPGADKGEFNEFHYDVDNQFFGTGIRGYGKGMGWSGKRLGRKKYNKMMRHWHAAPTELKVAVGAPILGGAGLADWYANHSEEASGD